MKKLFLGFFFFILNFVITIAQERQSIASGVHDTIGSSGGMILNFPIDSYCQKAGVFNGYWIQSRHQQPGKLLSGDEPLTMTNLRPDTVNKLRKTPKTHTLLEPEDGKVYHGAQTMTYESSADPLAGYLSALGEPTIHPAVRGFFMSIPGERGPDKNFIGLKNFLKAADSIGFIPELSLFFVGNNATDSIIAVSNQFDWIIDSAITLSKNYGKKMFVRIGGEFNGSGPGWNGGGYHPYLYVSMFRKITEMFRTKGFRDSIAVIWCYEPDAANDFDSVDSRGARWYPGDNYVDWFGLDVFDAAHFDLSLPDYRRGVITQKGKSERFLSMARAKGKPVYMSETSAKGVNISNDYSDGISDWDNWFKKFWEFIDVHKEIKGFSYINANWPPGAYPNWGDARIQNNQYIAQKYKEEMKKSKYIHLGYKTPIVKINNNGSFLPKIFLYQNFPNPFNPSTLISFQSPATGHISLKVYDIMGREVTTLVNEVKPAGRYNINFDAKNNPSGIYYYILLGNNLVESKRMILLK